MKHYKWECILGPLFKLFEATLELIVPLIIGMIIDVGVKNRDKTYILLQCLLLAALGLIGLLFSVTAQYFAARAAVGSTSRLKHELFAHLGKLSFANLDKIGSSTMITRMTSDMNQIQNGVNLTLRLLLRSPFVVFGAMIMAFTIDFSAALVFVCTIPVLSVIVFGIMLVSIPLYKRVQGALDRVLKTTRENLTGVRVIRAFRQESQEAEEFTRNNQTLHTEQRFVGRISALMNPLTYVVINIAIAILIYVGAIRVEHGILTQGAVIALYNYMSQILVELIKMANLIINITKSIACANRVQSIFRIEAGMKTYNDISDEKHNNDAIRFENVTLRYNEGADAALSDISFSAAPGETIGIIGGTGSGKSTLVQLIPRFYDVESGRVTVNGVDVRAQNPDALRDRIGYVPQKAALIRGTVRENLHMGNPHATDDALWCALETAQVRSVIEEKDGGLDFVIEQGGRNL